MGTPAEVPGSAIKTDRSTAPGAHLERRGFLFLHVLIPTWGYFTIRAKAIASTNDGS
jgi:hypothetical protein